TRAAIKRKGQRPLVEVLVIQRVRDKKHLRFDLAIASFDRETPGGGGVLQEPSIDGDLVMRDDWRNLRHVVALFLVRRAALGWLPGSCWFCLRLLGWLRLCVLCGLLFSRRRLRLLSSCCCRKNAGQRNRNHDAADRSLHERSRSENATEHTILIGSGMRKTTAALSSRAPS